MEVKEAADLLDNLIGMVEDSGGRDYDTALNMGVEALTSKPTDCISRQAAKNAVRDELKRNPTMAIRTMNAIDNLPSAQPERGYIEQIRWERDTAIQQLKELGYGLGEKPRTQPDFDEWCYSCKEYDSERHCCPRWNRVIRKTLEDAQPEIIHCKDCKNSEHWYKDRRRCFLWSEDGVSVFDDGFCNYAERRTDATTI